MSSDSSDFGTSADSKRATLAPEANALDDAFYGGQHENEIEKIRLQIRELEARRELAEATGISDEALLAELAGLGIRIETLAALTLLPLISVAWCDGEMHDSERAAILAGAESTGIERGSPAYGLLELWTQDPPPPDLARAWQTFITALCKKLDATGRARLETNLLTRAESVASSAGDQLERSPHISNAEKACLASLAAPFRG